MYADRRQQPALSTTRVRVNYFQRRLPAASIRPTPAYVCMYSRGCVCLQYSFVLPLLSFVYSISFPSLHDPTRTISFLSFSFPDHFRPDDPRLSVLVDAASVLRLVSVDARRRELFTNARDYRKFVGAAAGLRASWKKTGIVAFSAKQCSANRRSRTTNFHHFFYFPFFPFLSFSLGFFLVSLSIRRVECSSWQL